MMTKFDLLSFRAEHLRDILKENFEYEELQVLGELVKSYITSPDTSSLTLPRHFSEESVKKVFNQLGLKEPQVTVFPNGKTTRIEMI